MIQRSASFRERNSSKKNTQATSNDSLVNKVHEHRKVDYHRINMTLLKYIVKSSQHDLKDAEHSHNLKQAGKNVLLMLAITAAFFGLTNQWSFVDSLWFSFVTLTTIGYGDLTPETTFSRTMFIFLSKIGLGSMTLFLAEMIDYGNRHRENRRLAAERIRLAENTGEVDSNKSTLHTRVCCGLLPSARTVVQKAGLKALHALLSFAVAMIVGASMLTWSEGWVFIDSIYFAFQTSSTIGYGDQTSLYRHWTFVSDKLGEVDQSQLWSEIRLGYNASLGEVNPAECLASRGLCHVVGDDSDQGGAEDMHCDCSFSDIAKLTLAIYFLLSAGSLAALFDAIMTYSEALSLETKRMAARASTAVKKKAESFKDAVFGDSDSDGEGNGDGDGDGASKKVAVETDSNNSNDNSDGQNNEKANGKVSVTSTENTTTENTTTENTTTENTTTSTTTTTKIVPESNTTKITRKMSNSTPAMMMKKFRRATVTLRATQKTTWYKSTCARLSGVCFACGVYMLFGSIVFILLEPETFDTLWASYYFCATTLTTIGFGDYTVSTPAGKIFVIFYGILGIAMVSRLLSNTQDEMAQGSHDRVACLQKHICCKESAKKWPNRVWLLIMVSIQSAVVYAVGVCLFIVFEVAVGKSGDFLIDGDINGTKWSDLDVLLFFNTVTTTTVGYGANYYPRTDAGRMYLVFFSWVALANTFFLVEAITLFVKQQSQERWELRQKDLMATTGLTELTSLLDADGDGEIDDCVVESMMAGDLRTFEAKHKAHVKT